MSDNLPPDDPKKVDYRGRAAYVLAFSLGASIVVLSALAALDTYRTGELSPQTGGVLAAVFSGIIGAVATYMGGRASEKPTDPGAAVQDYKDLVAKIEDADITPIQQQVEDPAIQSFQPVTPPPPAAPRHPPASGDDYPQVPSEYL